MRGFTLIELLVALFITAIMMAMGYGVVNQVTKGRLQLQQQTARIIGLQRTLRMLEQDISLMQPRPVRDPLGGSTDLSALVAMPSAQLSAANASGSSAASSSSGSSSSSAASITVSSLNLQSTAVLSLTRGGWANPVGIARPEEQRVSYQLENAKLIRYHFAVLDATGETPMTRVELIDNVVSLSFRFMDNGHNWQNDWQLSGSSRQTQRNRPLAVEVTLVLKDLGKIVRVIEVAG